MQIIMIQTKIWDVVVVGGGPAGMIAAGRAAELGRSVLLLEKNQILGKKLLLTGGGRCNFTNNKPTLRALVMEYQESAQYLFSAFSQFGPTETIEFFNRLGVECKEEENGRVFPVSNKAETILSALIKYLKENKTQVQTSASVIDISRENDVFRINLQNDQPIYAKACVVATGGKANPRTGSTGEGFKWLKNLGHEIIESRPALVPVQLSDYWAKDLSGVVAKEVELSLVQKKKKVLSANGDLLFTHFGITGPMVLNASKKVGELLKEDKVIINVNLLPARNEEELKKDLQKLLDDEAKKKIKNALGQMIPKALAPILLGLAGVDGEIFCHSVTKEMRQKILELIKSLPLHVSALIGEEQAIYSHGGVLANEVDFKTMASRLIPNLFIVGDVLDIERRSGGYSLQLCWTTGYIAGSHINIG